MPRLTVNLLRLSVQHSVHHKQCHTEGATQLGCRLVTGPYRTSMFHSHAGSYLGYKYNSERLLTTVPLCRGHASPCLFITCTCTWERHCSLIQGGSGNNRLSSNRGKANPIILLISSAAVSALQPLATAWLPRLQLMQSVLERMFLNMFSSCRTFSCCPIWVLIYMLHKLGKMFGWWLCPFLTYEWCKKVGISVWF